MKILFLTKNTGKTHKQTDTSSIEDQIKQLEEELDEIEQDESLSAEERQQKAESIELQINRLEQEKQQNNTQEVSSTTQTASVQQAQQNTMSSISSNRKLRFDSYETQSPAPSAGLYKMGHDQNGNPIIQVEESLEQDTASNQTPKDFASYLEQQV